MFTCVTDGVAKPLYVLAIALVNVSVVPTRLSTSYGVSG